MSKLITNIQLVDAAGNLSAGEILIDNDGNIAEVAAKVSQAADETIDGKGCMASPGFVDVHVHLREPGFEHKETI